MRSRRSRHADREESARYAATARRLCLAGSHADAIAPLERAARLAPDDASIHNDLGVAFMATRRFSDALRSLRASIAIQPDAAEAHYNLGLALQHSGQDQEAIVEHQKAVALSADLAGAHAQLGDLLSSMGPRSEAVASYQRAYEASPTTTLGYLSRAKALLAENRAEEAEGVLRRLVVDNGSIAMAHVLLGRISQEAGRFEEALDSFQRSVELDPSQANGYFGLVSSRRITDADRPWLARLRSRLEHDGSPATADVGASDRHRMMLHFAAGKALDDLGEYREAMRHFDAANAIRQRIGNFDRREIEERGERLVARFTPELFRKYAGLGHRDETPLLIVGMPRSGTTLVERILSSHPRIHGCGELEFWSEQGIWADADASSLANAAGGLQGDYLRTLRRDAPAALRVTDKMPFNFFWLGLVHLLFPNARIVHCQRNAIDTCLSIYSTPFPATWGFVSTLADLSWYYTIYRRIMDHWRKVIPSTQLIDVRYEETVREPDETARRLVAFANLPWDAACLRPDKNRDPVRTASSWQARQPIYRTSVDRWRGYEEWLGELRDL